MSRTSFRERVSMGGSASLHATVHPGVAMVRQTVTTPDAPSSPLVSQAVKAGAHVYVSGTTGIDVETGRMAGHTVQAQTRQALTNCQAVLRAAGATLDDVVEVGVLLSDPADF